uniref:Uncharacterized protein n=1 Tax=Chromera velia CCMP2878 TaxID=1169474 RepID=A0A0G4HTU7_9ALVE|eukprot:Cvel_31599.t1-p1 / transcript=Cvel_31599.t1 / gene=Cvel_31599 / organism=Chromera_velia_CCMP2878 / gene_product=hypothetical protein / transcript_product=hypothetical protein / location=Cvel_scaffold4741:757-1173(-) / protein_length=139 / sequence_SO=supercontig / SO=protein_coding / is_pseudo=false
MIIQRMLGGPGKCEMVETTEGEVRFYNGKGIKSQFDISDQMEQVIKKGEKKENLLVKVEDEIMIDDQHVDNKNDEEDPADRWEGTVAATTRLMSEVTPIVSSDEETRDDRSAVAEPQPIREESEETRRAFNKMLDELHQ